MTIRQAKLSDVVPILDIIDEAHKRIGRVNDGGIDRDYARKHFNQAVRSNGGHDDGACLFLVSEAAGIVQGYFLAALGPTYQIGKHLSAQDWHFFLAPDADPDDPLQILHTFEEWAEANPNIVEARIAPTNVFGEPDGRFAMLLEGQGFAKAGTLFVKRNKT
jgi:hypothetical protein